MSRQMGEVVFHGRMIGLPRAALLEKTLLLPAANITADHSMTRSRVVYSTPHSMLEFGLA